MCSWLVVLKLFVAEKQQPIESIAKVQLSLLLSSGSSQRAAAQQCDQQGLTK